MLLYFTLIALEFVRCASGVAAPLVTWVSQPTMPNETAVLWGEQLHLVAAFTITPVSRGSLPASRNSKESPATLVPFDVSNHSAKIILPPTMSPGVYRICPGTVPPNSTGACVLCNGPDVFWYRGDVNLSHASVGGWVRVFGRLADDAGRLAVPELLLTPLMESDGTPISVVATNHTANDAFYRLPPKKTPGTYRLALGAAGIVFSVEGPGGGEANLTLAAPVAWPGSDRVFKVNSTTALFQALAASRTAGGGVVVLQRGTYQFTTESLDLPPFTVLRGVRTDLVSMVWRTEGIRNLTTVPRYLVGGNATFAVEDLTISATGFYHNVIMDGQAQDSSGVYQRSEYVRVVRVRIRTDCFFRLQERNAAPRRGLVANFTYEQTGAAIFLMGPFFEVSDCDIYTSDHGVYLGSHGEGPRNAEVGIASRNTINFGGDCYQIDSSSHIIFEDNTCLPRGRCRPVGAGRRCGSTWAGG